MQGPDLEKPYQDACKREERFQEIVERETKSLWHNLTDELFVEEFLYAYEPDNLLRDIVHRLAQTRGKLDKLCSPLTQPVEDLAAEMNKMRLAAYHSVIGLVVEEVEKVAELKAQRIYDMED